MANAEPASSSDELSHRQDELKRVAKIVLDAPNEIDSQILDELFSLFAVCGLVIRPVSQRVESMSCTDLTDEECHVAGQTVEFAFAKLAKHLLAEIFDPIESIIALAKYGGDITELQKILGTRFANAAARNVIFTFPEPTPFGTYANPATLTHSKLLLNTDKIRHVTIASTVQLRTSPSNNTPEFQHIRQRLTTLKIEFPALRTACVQIQTRRLPSGVLSGWLAGWYMAQAHMAFKHELVQVVGCLRGLKSRHEIEEGYLDVFHASTRANHLERSQYRDMRAEAANLILPAQPTSVAVFVRV